MRSTGAPPAGVATAASSPSSAPTLLPASQVAVTDRGAMLYDVTRAVAAACPQSSSELRATLRSRVGVPGRDPPVPDQWLPPGTGLVVERETARLSYVDGKYRCTIRRALYNAGTEPITRYLVRISVGIEDIDDILWDLDQALQASQAPAASA